MLIIQFLKFGFEIKQLQLRRRPRGSAPSRDRSCCRRRNRSGNLSLELRAGHIGLHEQAGVVVRPFAGEGVRVTIGEVEANDIFLRVAVLGGGCSGFQYTFNFDDARTDDDMVIAKDGAVVVIDSTSMDLLRGSQIDFVEDMVGSAFAIKNPNATSSCGCGNSFSV